ncbi:MAG: helix-turn-helix domain-containing protein [Oligoflexia bacterium]|nr:helix-turn-helix domain-containing protein [Oligoflexia bacterium]
MKNKKEEYKNVNEFAREIGVDDEALWAIEQKIKMIKKMIELRKKRDLTQADLAQILGTTQSVIARIETGVSRRVSFDYLVKILRVLGVSAEFKFKELKVA